MLRARHRTNSGVGGSNDAADQGGNPVFLSENGCLGVKKPQNSNKNGPPTNKPV